MALETITYDPADFLIDDATISAYLTVSLEEDDPAYFVRALGAVARARNRMPELASELGMPIAILDALLRDGQRMELSAVVVIMRHLGITLSATLPVESDTAHAAVA